MNQKQIDLSVYLIPPSTGDSVCLYKDNDYKGRWNLIPVHVCGVLMALMNAALPPAVEMRFLQ